jgi:hypothetical protein
MFMVRRIGWVLGISALLIATVFSVGAQAAELEVGTPLDDELSDSRTTAEYTFEGEADQVVSVSVTSDDFDTYVTITNADGDVLAQDDDSGGSLDSLVGFLRLEESGTYTVEVSSVNSTYGSFTVSVDTTEVLTIGIGDEVEGELSTVETTQSYVFEGESGQSITATLISEDFDTTLALLDSNGNQIAYNDDGAGNGDSLIAFFEIPANGTYTFQVAAYSTSYGDYTLSVESPTVENVELGTPIEASFGGASSLYFRLEADAGSVLNISVDSEADTTVILRDSGSYELFRDEDSGSGDNPEITNYSLTYSSDFYLIEVLSVDGDSEESVTVTVEAAELPSLNDGAQTINLSSNSVSRVFTYAAEADETVRITVSIDGDVAGSPTVTIYQGDLYIGYLNGTYTTEVSAVFTVAEAGDLNIRVEDYTFYSDGEMTISVEVVE